MVECLQGALFLIPPVLTISELQIPLPGSEAHWEADNRQWQQLSAPPATSPICVALTSIGLRGAFPDDLSFSAQLTVLASSFFQYTAVQDLRRAMMLFTGDSYSAQPGSSSGTVVDLLHSTFDVLCKSGRSKKLEVKEAHTVSNEISIMARVLTILDFTPGRLLYPFSRWQTSDYGTDNARKELSRIFGHDTGRARHCLHNAAQVFHYYRMTSALHYFDTLNLLVCTIYIHAYIELIANQSSSQDAQTNNLGSQEMLRLDEVFEGTQVDEWTSLRREYQPHITGVGFLGIDRSISRLYKESSRIMGRSASKSIFAAALQPLMMAQAAGIVPTFPDKE